MIPSPATDVLLTRNHPGTLASSVSTWGGVIDRDLTFTLAHGETLEIWDEGFGQVLPISTDLQPDLEYRILLCSFPQGKMTYSTVEQPSADSAVWQGQILDPQWHPPQDAYLCAIQKLHSWPWILVSSRLGPILLPGSMVDIPIESGAYLRWEVDRQMLVAVWSIPQPTPYQQPQVAASWQREPAPTLDRQQWLTQRLQIAPDRIKDRYPFVRIPLARADVEWLLRVHQSAGVHGTFGGPVDWNIPSQRDRPGLDLRGADLRGSDLSGLPVARLVGGLYGDEWLAATPSQREASAIHLEGALLQETHLEGSLLRNAHLEGADLSKASLTSALLREAHLSRANMHSADLSQTLLSGAQMAETDLSEARLVETDLNMADLQKATMDQAELYDVQGQGTNFAGTSLRRAQITHTFFYRAHLEQADLTDAQVVDTNLRLGGVF